jgi:YD repeat-containing protein
MQRRAFDARGNHIETTSFDATGARTTVNGYHRMEARYTDRGAIARRAFYDAHGRPTPGPDGFAEARLAYDARGNMTERVYFGSDGQPTGVKGVHKETLAYDKGGRLLRQAFFDPKGEPCPGPDGFAAITSEYHPNGELRRRVAYKPDGQPLWDLYFNAHGLRTEGKRFDNPGEVELQTYDSTGSQLAKSVFLERATGRPLRHILFNRDGHIVERATLDAQGKPAIGPNKYAVARYKHDDQGRVVEEEYFDVAMKPTPNQNGFVRMRTRYEGGRAAEVELIRPGGGFRRLKQDERGQFTEMIERTDDGKPFPNTSCVEIVTRFKEKKRHEAECIRTDGTRYRNRYDAAERLVETSWWDAQGRPTPNDLGAARERYGYDARGRQTRIEYLDEAGKPVHCKLGYAVVERTFGPDGAPLDVAFKDLAGKARDVTIRITELVADGQAKRLGVQPGDLVESYDGKRIRQVPQLQWLTAQKGPAKRALVVRRGGQVLTFKVDPGPIGILLEERAAPTS